jgi:hypothetical protein
VTVTGEFDGLTGIVNTGGTVFECFPPTSVLTGTNTCGDEAADCDDFGDLTTQRCVSAPASANC